MSKSSSKKTATAKKLVVVVLKKKNGGKANKPNPLHAKLEKLFTQKGGCTMHDTYNAGFPYPAMAALKMMERRGYKVSTKKVPHRLFGDKAGVVTMSQWQLVNSEGKAVNIGDEVTTFRGERVTITGLAPPHKPESSGKIHVEHKRHGCDGIYYPSVVNCRYVRE